MSNEIKQKILVGSPLAYNGPPVRGCKTCVDKAQLAPSPNDLFATLCSRNNNQKLGQRPSWRLTNGYFQPNVYYEAMVDKCLPLGAAWLDVGGGHQVFPSNPRLATILAQRAGSLTVVDPSDNVLRNEFASERVQEFIEEFECESSFDLATFRMVVEHIAQPDRVAQSLSRLIKPGGLVVMNTVYLWSPITVISRVVPDRFHTTIKKWIWGSKKENTFSTCYLMNTQNSVKQVMEKHGFEETYFSYLDDVTVFNEFGQLALAELKAWRLLRSCGLPFPERNILAVYRKCTATTDLNRSR